MKVKLKVGLCDKMRHFLFVYSLPIYFNLLRRSQAYANSVRIFAYAVLTSIKFAMDPKYSIFLPF